MSFVSGEDDTVYCDQNWELTVWPSDRSCRDCDFVLETELELSPGSDGGRDCWLYGLDELAFGFTESPRRGYSGIYMEYYSEFYPLWYGELEDGYAWFEMGFDYADYYDGYSYFWWLAGGMEIPD